MEATFFDDENFKTNKTVLCPECRTKHKLAIDDSDVCCEVCGECLETEAEDTSSDFIWHPSVLF